MSTDDLLKIEQQGYDFVRALIPHLATASRSDEASYLWDVVTAHRLFKQFDARRSPKEWRLLNTRDGSFYAGAETAVREFEARQ